MDEEELLLETPSTFDVSNLSELDESAILGDDDIQEEGSVKDEVVEHNEETEELDYDEDLEAEKAPRSSKFTSERALMQRRSLMNEASSRRENQNRNALTKNIAANKSVEPLGLEENSSPAFQVQSVNSTKTSMTRAPKVFINPHHRGVIRPQGSAPRTLSLPWETVVKVPNVPGLRHPITLPLPNSVAILPQVSHSVPFPIVPSSSADFSRPPPQIMPLPNYSTPPPSVYPNQFMTESLRPIPSVGQWDQMVEGFLRRTTARSRSRFSRSPRSSSSSRSRSRSYSSHSSSSTMSSRSSSRSPYRRVHSRSRRSSSRRPLNYRSRNDMIRRHPGDRFRQSGDSHRESVYHSDHRSRANDVAKQEKTIECAKAIGLDNEYLTKLEEQKKMREVILRKKEERRIQTVQRLGGPISMSDQKSSRQLSRPNNFGEQRSERSRRMDEEYSSKRKFESKTRKTSGIRNGRKELASETNSEVSRETANISRLESSICTEKGVSTNSSIIQKMEPAAAGNDSGVEQTTAKAKAAVTSIRATKLENEQNLERARKKKAYLAVVVNSLNQAPIDVDRIRIIAETVGRTKKVWRSSENTVSLIFEEHESAKKFMFHYHKVSRGIISVVIIVGKSENIQALRYFTFSRVIHGVQLAVTLQKLFANLTELP